MKVWAVGAVQSCVAVGPVQLCAVQSQPWGRAKGLLPGRDRRAGWLVRVDAVQSQPGGVR